MSDRYAETQIAKSLTRSLRMNLARAMESSGQALADYLKRARESGEISDY